MPWVFCDCLVQTRSVLRFLPVSPISFFFFNDTATTEIYTLSLHDALPISLSAPRSGRASASTQRLLAEPKGYLRSEEHTSELQSPVHLVCRLLLEKKKNHTKPSFAGDSDYCQSDYQESARDRPFSIPLSKS